MRERTFEKFTDRDIRTRVGLDYLIKSPGEIQEKYDIAVDCSGSAPAMEVAVSSLNHGGRLCIFGVSNPKAKLTIEPFQVSYVQLRYNQFHHTDPIIRFSNLSRLKFEIILSTDL